MASRPPVAAVFNTSTDVIDMLRVVLEQAGFMVVSRLTPDIREGRVDLETFVRENEPNVIVYDIAPPYEPNWRLFEQVTRSSALRNCPIVLTSTNADRVRDLTGINHRVIYEIVGKPFDLDEIVRAVREASRARPTA